ncbi:MAG: hypothetical protein OER04_06695 [Cyclobacteriaceae bacterium]|nr:hypothetical protein [Cyclobacteriaceae bacterium]
MKFPLKSIIPLAPVFSISSVGYGHSSMPEFTLKDLVGNLEDG